MFNKGLLLAALASAFASVADDADTTNAVAKKYVEVRSRADSLQALITETVRSLKMDLDTIGDLYRSLGVPIQPSTDPSDLSSLPIDCSELRKPRGQTKGGMYTIWPKYWYEPYDVLCDMDTEGGGWTIIGRKDNRVLRRRSATQNSTGRSFEEHESGFGNPLQGDYWLGHEKVFALTNQANMSLRMDMNYLTTFATWTCQNVWMGNGFNHYPALLEKCVLRKSGHQTFQESDEIVNKKWDEWLSDIGFENITLPHFLNYDIKIRPRYFKPVW